MAFEWTNNCSLLQLKLLSTDECSGRHLVVKHPLQSYCPLNFALDKLQKINSVKIQKDNVLAAWNGFDGV